MSASGFGLSKCKKSQTFWSMPCFWKFKGTSNNEGASIDSIIRSTGTSVKVEILSLCSWSIGCSARSTSIFGWIPILRNSATECCVGLVFISWAAWRSGTKVQWMYITFSGPTSRRIWRIASMNGVDSISPTVPPISEIITSESVVKAARMIFFLIMSVIWGITCTVAPW